MFLEILTRIALGNAAPTHLAVAPSIPTEPMPPRQQLAGFMAPNAYHGLPAEIATPPPRRS